MDKFSIIGAVGLLLTFTGFPIISLIFMGSCFALIFILWLSETKHRNTLTPRRSDPKPGDVLMWVMQDNSTGELTYKCYYDNQYHDGMLPEHIVKQVEINKIYKPLYNQTYKNNQTS